VVAGEGVVTLDGKNIDVRRGDAVDVPHGAAHRIHNTGSVPLVSVEVQHGDYFGEDDTTWSAHSASPPAPGYQQVGARNRRRQSVPACHGWCHTPVKRGQRA
jgi:uncharacterized cupin superfamily protein